VAPRATSNGARVSLQVAQPSRAGECHEDGRGAKGTDPEVRLGRFPDVAVTAEGPDGGAAEQHARHGQDQPEPGAEPSACTPTEDAPASSAAP
jgi:hypothetical protein